MTDSEKTFDLSDRELIQRVWSRLKPYRKRIVFALSLLVLSVPFINFHPLIWGFVADALIDQTLTLNVLVWWLVVMSVGYLIGVVAHGVHSYLLEKTGQAFVRDIRAELFRKFEDQSVEYHRDRSSGELVTRITSDVDAMEQSVLQGLTSLLEEIVTFIFVAMIVIWISPFVGLASIMPLALAFIFIKKYNRKVKAVYVGVRSKLGGIGSFVQDRLAGVLVTKSFGREAEEAAAFQKNADGFYESSIRASRLRNTFFPMVSLLGFVNNVIMLGLGAWLILSESPHFTLGALLAYRGFWWRLQSPIRTIAQTSDILQRARAAATRIMELLDEPIAITDRANATTLEHCKGRIEFDRVSFAYHSVNTILKSVSLAIPAGEFVAIAGGSGAGKSTLLNLIPRFFEVDGGSIQVDGVDIRDLTMTSLRRQIGYVGQDHYLFDGTVRENLVYGYPEATEAEVIEATIKANAHVFIGTLPNGYETPVGQNGVKLSGGQRQRLSLARAFLTAPTVLLLDEPTASVEPESEALIHDAIIERTQSGHGSTILVTHRVDLLRKAPRILFVNQGLLAGDGTHEALVQTCSAYADAYHRWQVQDAARLASA